jgi:hypothetical protein
MWPWQEVVRSTAPDYMAANVSVQHQGTAPISEQDPKSEARNPKQTENSNSIDQAE